MKCVIPSPNVKIMARAVHSLAKIGDEMYIQPSAEDLILRTINLPKSAFAEFRMCKNFFSYFSYNDSEDTDSKCKVTMKSFLSVFKSAHNLDKQVENCELRQKPDTTLVVLQIKFTNTSVKKYFLPIIESDQLEAQIPTGAPNQLAASSKLLSSSLKNFRHSEDEITLAVGREKAVIKNHLELRRDLSSMRTELCFHQNEFESYVVGNPTSVTFCLKELRSIVTFAEPANLPIIITFTQPGRPIVFQVLNHPAYEINYVVSTLNTTEAERSKMSATRSTVSPRTTHQPDVTNETRNDPFSFECQEDNAIEIGKPIENTRSAEKNLADLSNKNISKKRKIPNIDEQEVKRRNTSLLESSRETSDITPESDRNINPLELKNDHKLSSLLNPTEPSLPAGCSSSLLQNESEKIHEPEPIENGSFIIPESNPESFQFPIIPGPSSAPDDVFKRPTARQESESSQPSPELLKTIFSRCFSKDHFLDALVGHDIILEESSDREIL